MAQKIVCPNCKKVIHSTENTCPNCGIAITDEMRRKNKVSLSGCLFIVFAIIIGCYFLFGGDDKNALPGTPLDYWVVDEDFIDTKDTQGISRGTYYVEIATMKLTDNATQADLISTAMQAAREYHKKTFAPIVNVRFQATGSHKLFTPTLAFITYVPDKKGIDGQTDSPVWLNVRACPRGFTQEEREYIRLYEELAPNYIDGKTLTISEENKKKLKAEIEQQLGMQFNTDPLANVLQNIKLSKQPK